MTETLATLTKLLVVEEILEDEEGATLRFQQGEYGRLGRRDGNYAADMALARRSKERRHPVGVIFGEGHAIAELIRADNDVPLQIADDGPDRAAVLFQGHDGVFQLRRDRPDFTRLRGLLARAVRQKVRIWFIAQKPELALLDVLLASEGVLINLSISFVVAPEHMRKKADQILRSRIRGTKALSRNIRAVAKAYLDEADELNRAVREIQTNEARIQLDSLSPPSMVEKARALRTVRLPNKDLQDMVRAVATSYVLIAEENQRLFDAFKAQLPPPASA
jgi:hypothetical protein